MTPRVAIAGISGRMGRLLEEEVQRAGLPFAGGASRSGTPLEAVVPSADVVIDFTNAASVVQHASLLSAANVGWVLGTSGLDAD